MCNVDPAPRGTSLLLPFSAISWEGRSTRGASLYSPFKGKPPETQKREKRKKKGKRVKRKEDRLKFTKTAAPHFSTDSPINTGSSTSLRSMHAVGTGARSSQQPPLCCTSYLWLILATRRGKVKKVKSTRIVPPLFGPYLLLLTEL